MRAVFTMWIMLIIISCFAAQNIAHAMNWKNLWSRPDQRGAHLLQQGKPKLAASHFENNNWKGVAYYRAGQYNNALAEFSKKKSAQNDYNRGNALAHLGQYEAAIQAYEAALKENPKNHDAKFNRDLLKKLLKKQKNNSANNKQKSPQKKPSSQTAKNKNKNQPQHQKKKEGQQPQQAKSQQKPQAKPTPQNKNPQQREQRQANNQWLRRIPDDPGGLLRRKFMRDYLRRHQQGSER